MDLANLIATYKGTRSYEQVARDCGEGVTGARIHQLATRSLRTFPEPATMARLARGLSVPVREVLLAAARSLGMNLPTGYDTDSMTLAGVANLPTAAREAIANVAREMVRLHEIQRAGEGSGQQPAATKQARDDAGRIETDDVDRWDRRAAPLRSAGYTERAVTDALGPRPVDARPGEGAGEVARGASHNDAGHGVDDRRRRLTS